MIFKHLLKHIWVDGAVLNIFVAKGDVPKHRIKLLDSVGFVWDFLGIDNRIRQFKEFVSIHGHARVPKSYGELGTWIHARMED